MSLFRHDLDRAEDSALRGWLIIGAVVTVLALPFAGLLPLYQWPPGIAATHSPLVLWHALGILGLAAWIWRRDAWLGAFAAYIALDALRAPMPARAWLMADAVTLGAAAYVLLQRLTWPWTDMLRCLLGLSAWGQAAIAGLQRLGWDPFYAKDAPFQQAATMVGTLGNDTWLGAYLALVGAIAPRWAIPACLAGLFLARNRLGLIALVIALTFRYRRSWPSIVGLLALGAVALWWADKTLDTVISRWAVWHRGLAIWWEHGRVFGLGPGSWAWYLPQFDQREFFAQAHNEYVQLLFEGGLVGLLMLAAWLWTHHARLLRHPGAWALAVLCFGTFPLHVAIVAATAILVLALPEEAGEPAALGDLFDGRRG